MENIGYQHKSTDLLLLLVNDGLQTT